MQHIKLTYPADYTGFVAEYPNGSKEWWLNGQRHRVDGPAREWADGTKNWYLNGNFIYALEPIGDYILIEDGLPLLWRCVPISLPDCMCMEV